jgi:hypothetical protein
LSGSATNSSLSDWITAVATAATALFAAITGLAAWLAYRRQARHDFPVVELEFENIGPHIRLQFTILNRLDETLIIHKCWVKKPKGATVSTGVISSNGALVPSKGNASHLQLDYKVPRSGAYRSGPLGEGFVAADILTFPIFVSLPDKWQSSVLIIQLLISSRASTIRDKRIAIKRIIAADPHTKIDAKAR